jgi:hypothetical protein
VPAEALPALVAVPAGARPASVDLPGLGRYRLIATERARPDGTTVAVVTGQSERPVQDTVATLVAIEAVAVAVRCSAPGAGFLPSRSVGR